MDIPILSSLEKIYPNQDTGAVAIRKLVKNQNLIEQGIKEIDGINDLDPIREQINVLSNPNLLINGDFQVWQRGESFDIPSTGASTYTADRWVIQTNSQGVSATKLLDGGISVNNSSFDGTYLNICQFIELETYKRIKGKNVAITIKFKNSVSNIILGLRAFPDSSGVVKKFNGDKIVLNTTIPICSTDCTKFMLYLQSTQTQKIEIEYVKLELGTVATPFTPRIYAEELAMCERYYQKVRVQERIYNYNANELYAITNLRTIMRVVPTLAKISEPAVSYIAGGKIDGYVFDTTSWSGAIKSITLRATKNSHGLTEAVLKAELELDAEIY